MADFVSKSMRRNIMRGVRPKHTKPEIKVRQSLHRMGYRFRLHRKDLPGKPDIVLPKHRIVIQVHGCFWHQHQKCPIGRRPSSNVEYWNAKLDRNIERDAETKDALEKLGWTVWTVWECETKDEESLEALLGSYLDPGI